MVPFKSNLSLMSQESDY